MKACPLCSSTFDERVDFCFRDGAPLVAASAEVEAAARAERGIPRFGNGLEIPEPPTFDITDAPEPTSLRSRAVPSAPPPPPGTPPAPMVEGGDAQSSGDEEAPPDPERLSVDAPDTGPFFGEFGSEFEDSLRTGAVPADATTEDLDEPDSAEFFAEENTDYEDSSEEDEEDFYGGIPYADSPQRSQLPKVLAAISVLLVLGALFAFGGGEGEEEDGTAPEQVAAPAVQDEKEPRKPDPVVARAASGTETEAPKEDDEPAEVAEVAEVAEENIVESETASEEERGLGSVDRAVERERRRQEARAERERRRDEERSERDQEKTAQAEEARRQADEEERREAERREADRRASQKEKKRRDEPVAVSSPGTAANPWGKVDDATSGTLTVRSVPPGARVWIDNEARGSAPVSAKLRFGSHKVKVAKDGYKAKTMVIDLQSTRQELDFRLAKDVASGPVIIYGTLGAKVYLGDKLLGPIPVSTTLPEGTHTFTVVQEGTFYKVTKTVSFANVKGTLPITVTQP